jgi:SAM-dependent methyltransferase
VRCANAEYSIIVSTIKEAITGLMNGGRSSFSLLDIGAGNGHLLSLLCADGMTPAHYVAFEPDADLCFDLKTRVRDLEFTKDQTKIYPSSFMTTTKVSQAGGVADVVLLSQSLYGVEDKQACVANALSFVAPGGVLLIFHRWTPSGTIAEISRALFEDKILHYMHTYDVALDLSSLTLEEIGRLSTYTKQDLLASGRTTAMRPLGYLAVEPYACRLGSPLEILSSIEGARKEISYSARSKVPAAVVQPNTGKMKTTIIWTDPETLSDPHLFFAL